MSVTSIIIVMAFAYILIPVIAYTLRLYCHRNSTKKDKVMFKDTPEIFELPRIGEESPAPIPSSQGEASMRGNSTNRSWRGQYTNAVLQSEVSILIFIKT
eukprot:UN04854